MMVEDGRIAPSLPELCPDSHMTKLELYVHGHKDLKRVFIKSTVQDSWKLCVSTSKGVYERRGQGNKMEDYEKIAESLLNDLSENMDALVFGQDVVLHSKHPEFETEEEYRHWKKIILLRDHKIMVPEVNSESFMSRVETHVLYRKGKIYISYPSHVSPYSPSVIIVSLPGRNEICEVILNYDMKDIEDAFKRIYYKMFSSMIDGRTYFVKQVDFDGGMSDAYMGKYDAASNMIGDKLIKSFINMGYKNLAQFHEYVPFKPDIAYELQYGKQLHKVWLIGNYWCRRIDIEFEGIQFGYPTYKMYVNHDHTPYISYKNGQFVDNHDNPLTISL